MISGIVYTSNSGYTAQYARLLGAALDLPVTDAKWGTCLLYTSDAADE